MFGQVHTLSRSRRKATAHTRQPRDNGRSLHLPELHNPAGWPNAKAPIDTGKTKQQSIGEHCARMTVNAW